MAPSRISTNALGELQTPAEPLIPFVQGTGTRARAVDGVRRVVDRAVERVFEGTRRIAWVAVQAGEASMRTHRTTVPDATVEAVRDHHVVLLPPLVYAPTDLRLEQELTELLDLFLGAARFGKSTLFFDTRESGASGLAFDEGGANAQRLERLLAQADVLGATAPSRMSGWALADTSRLGVLRLVQGALDVAARTGVNALVPTLVVSPGVVDASMRKWGDEVVPLTPLPLDEALSLLLADSRLPRMLIASARSATHVVRLAVRARAEALAVARINPQTGHGVFAPTRDDLPDELIEQAVFEAAVLLLHHIGWRDVALELDAERRVRTTASG